MNPIVINTADMDALVEVLLKFHGEDMDSWPHHEILSFIIKQTSSTIQKQHDMLMQQESRCTFSFKHRSRVCTQLYTRVVSTAVLYFLL
jgi:hypothetical protein